jgi:O-antigen ligase
MLKKKAVKVVIYPAVIVILFGLLQILVLPKDFLAHFGYGPNTIYPFETINHNSHYLRIASTLRGANPLGAYLIVPLTLATVLLMRGKDVWHKAVFIALGLVVLIFSFSRSAWIGFVVAGFSAVYLSVKSLALKRNLLLVVLGIAIVIAGILISDPNNSKIQNIVFHYQNKSSSQQSSDQAHSSALKNSFKQFIKEPLGKGPGTSGPASVYNTRNSNIPEDYYLQIGLETGYLGLALFLAINILVVMSLWKRRYDPLSLALLASFIGLIVCNLLLEAWTDDTLAYLWWGLAGVVFATQPKIPKVSKRKTT